MKHGSGPDPGIRWVTLLIGLVLVMAACSTAAATETTTTSTTQASNDATTTTTTTHGHADDVAEGDGATHDGEMAQEDRVAATLAAAGFQDVSVAEAAGYGSTMDGLGCFEDSAKGGMGLHYLNESLMDDKVDITTPEALVYELNADGEIVGLIAHEYIIPVDAWTETAPPTLFGRELHQHPTLPLWVMHAWVWKDNPAGIFEDWNPAVRLCPEGVPIFGVDLP